MRVGWSYKIGSKDLHFFGGRYSLCGELEYPKFRMNGENYNYPHPWDPDWRFLLRTRGKKTPRICGKCHVLYFDIVNQGIEFIEGTEEVEEIRRVVQSW